MKKIIPRNKTARAMPVRGNPAISLPHSGVDNSYPGLELDPRNLDQHFFPGLVVYFHRTDGACVVESSVSGASELREDSVDLVGMFLWAVCGQFFPEDSSPSLLSFQGQPGSEVRRRIREILPGPLAVLLGVGPPDLRTMEFAAELLSRYNSAATSEVQVITLRDPAGLSTGTILLGRRTDFFTADGVIDPMMIREGELTKTMCSPWMYDFRDCFCFFWAASKPDIVDVEYEGTLYRQINFLRAAGAREETPVGDVALYVTQEGGRRSDTELTHADLISGYWNKLPVVLGGKETPEGVWIGKLKSNRRLDSLKAIGNRLTHLATVEHALIVQYLYAYYSAAVVLRPEDAVSTQSTSNTMPIRPLAEPLLRIAIDEMRHLIWANEALAILGFPPSTGRAKFFRPKDESAAIQPQWTFSLRPFSLEAIRIFIEIEKPSQNTDGLIDGLYVQTLESLNRLDPESKAIPILKLLIDEGNTHWQAFEQLATQVLKYAPNQLSIQELHGPLRPEDQQFLRVADLYYGLILRLIQFCVSHPNTSELLASSVRLMHNLDEILKALADRGVLYQFAMPRGFGAKRADHAISSMHSSLDRQLKRLSATGALARSVAQKQLNVLASNAACFSASTFPESSV